ncbi:MAG: Asp-tRNA(Asn)/Glu-tRNA(Gln) amidotransferase subunit GatC [Anaerolineales bacterium]
MSDEITPELFNYLVELAALELSTEEGEYLRRQLNNQLKAIHELEWIAIPNDVPPAAHGVSLPTALRPPLREDTPVPSETAAAILQGAPESEEGFFVVP